MADNDPQNPSNVPFEAVTEVLLDALETSTMVFAEAVEPDELAVPGPTALQITMQFKGPGQGTLNVVTSKDMARELTANTLGLDEDDPEVEESFCDALGELCNVLLGVLLGELTEETAVFDLSAPEFRNDVGVDQWQSIVQGGSSIGFDADGEPILVRLVQEGGEIPWKERE